MSHTRVRGSTHFARPVRDCRPMSPWVRRAGARSARSRAQPWWCGSCPRRARPARVGPVRAPAVPDLPRPEPVPTAAPGRGRRRRQRGSRPTRAAGARCRIRSRARSGPASTTRRARSRTTAPTRTAATAIRQPPRPTVSARPSAEREDAGDPSPGGHHAIAPAAPRPSNKGKRREGSLGRLQEIHHAGRPRRDPGRVRPRAAFKTVVDVMVNR